MLVSLARTADGHPFTLNHLAHYIQALGVTYAVDDLQGGLEETTERFKVSLQQRLSPQEFDALQSITILHREISLDGLCQTAQVTPGVIKRLREEGLLQASDTGKFWLPNIVKTSLKSPSPEVMQQAHLRATNFYRSQKVSPSHQSIDDYASILEWHHHAVQAGDATSSYTALFSTGLKDQLMAWNEYSLLADLTEATLSVTSREHQELSSLEWVTIQQTLGIAEWLLGKYSLSVNSLRTALKSLAPGEYPELRINLLIDLAQSYGYDEDLALAMETCQEFMGLLIDIQNEGLRAKALLVRGVINRNQRKLDQAMDDLENSLKLYERINDRQGIAHSIGELGIVYYYQNNFNKAIANYKRTLDLCESRGDARGAIIGHFNMGDILLQTAQYELAEKEFQLAWENARKKKILNVEIMAGLFLVETQIALSHLDGIDKKLSELNALISPLQSQSLSGQELVLHASLKWKRSQFEQAKESFDGAIALLSSGNYEYELARAYIPYAGFLKDWGRPEEAKNTLEKGKKIFTTLNDGYGLQIIEKALSDF